MDEENKVIYEINEVYHFLKKRIKKDKRKYGYLVHNGWKINIIFDFFQKKITKHWMNRILAWKENFKDLTNSIVVYVDDSPKILTDEGFSSFDGIVKYANKHVNEYLIDDNKLICTEDHQIYDDHEKAYHKANEYEKEKDIGIQDVYDIINVKKNNRFIVNGNINVHNCLVCDEFAFIAPGISDEFMQSVFPVVSSSKTSKIIIVSTPNGMGNEFYNIWNRATLGYDNTADEAIRWHYTKVDWYEVPGRDEKWKQIQLESMGGNLKKFSQEYGCSFLGSADTLIDSEILKKYKDDFINRKPKSNVIQLHNLFENTKIQIFYPPVKGHSYVIGADPSMGLGNDYQAMSVWDITNTFDIKQVATFYENNVIPRVFAYILVKTAMLYGDALLALENNGVSQVTLTSIWQDYEYDNILTEGGNPRTSIGISSSGSRKISACLNFKSIIEDEMRKIEINDGRLIGEIEKFERKNRQGKIPTYEAADGHDDFIMATIWAFFSLKQEITERYFDVKKSIVNKMGESMPLYVLPFEDEEVEFTGYRGRNIDDLEAIDKKLSMFKTDYDKDLKKMIVNSDDSMNMEKNMNKIAKETGFDIIDDNVSNFDEIRSNEDDGFNFDAFS